MIEWEWRHVGPRMIGRWRMTHDCGWRGRWVHQLRGPKSASKAAVKAADNHTCRKDT